MSDTKFKDMKLEGCWPDMTRMSANVQGFTERTGSLGEKSFGKTKQGSGFVPNMYWCDAGSSPVYSTKE
jgi:hypothetical protein